MGKHHLELPREVSTVRARIDHWRDSRQKQSRMPAELWSAAAALAVEHGIHRISQALRLSYDSLKTRVVQLESKQAPAGSPSSGFVEVQGLSVTHGVEQGTVEVEVSDRDGERMKVSVCGRGDVDVVSMVEGFWQRRR